MARIPLVSTTDDSTSLMDYVHTEAHQRAYDISVQLHDRVTKFPNKEKFVLQQEIRDAIDCILDEIEMFEITKSASHIYAADRQKRRLVRKIRLAYDMRYMNEKNYLYWSKEIGKMGACLGGLIKKAKDKKF